MRAEKPLITYMIVKVLTERQTDRYTDDGCKVIAIAHRFAKNNYWKRVGFEPSPPLRRVSTSNTSASDLSTTVPYDSYGDKIC